MLRTSRGSSQPYTGWSGEGMEVLPAHPSPAASLAPETAGDTGKVHRQGQGWSGAVSPTGRPPENGVRDGHKGILVAQAWEPGYRIPRGSGHPQAAPSLRTWQRQGTGTQERFWLPQVPLPGLSPLSMAPSSSIFDAF